MEPDWVQTLLLPIFVTGEKIMECYSAYILLNNDNTVYPTHLWGLELICKCFRIVSSNVFGLFRFVKNVCFFFLDSSEPVVDDAGRMDQEAGMDIFIGC